MSKSLFHIEKELLELHEQIEMQGGELTPEQEAFLQINETELKQKSLNYIHFIKKLENDIDLADTYIEQATAVKKQRTKQIERLKDALKQAVEIYGTIEVDLFKVSLRPSESTIIENEDEVPPQFKTIKQMTVINKTAIKQAIKEGQTVKGAYLQTNQNLNIK